MEKHVKHKKASTKFWNACLGIATEIIMAIFLMAVVLGLSWLISHR